MMTNNILYLVSEIVVNKFVLLCVQKRKMSKQIVIINLNPHKERGREICKFVD